MKSNRTLGLGLGFSLGLVYFILNSFSLIRDVIYSRLYLDEKKYKVEMSDEQPLGSLNGFPASCRKCSDWLFFLF